jgi:cell division protein FtsI/penicillin-binding protein 2
VTSSQLEQRRTAVAVLCALLYITARAQKPINEKTNPKENVSGALQHAIRTGMAGMPGATVVVDVASGKILAQQGVETAARRLTTPGSTVKPFVLMALLRSQKLKADETFLCRRTLRIAGKRMDCTHPQLAAPLDAEEALAYSCNSYFAAMAVRISAADLASEFRRAGFDSPTNWSAREAVGVVNETRTPEERQLQALGEKAVKITPLELLAAYRTLALEHRSGDKTWEPIYRGLADSATYGMAHAAAPDGCNVAGKTGTANSSASALTHGWFAGYAPAEKPEIALVVYLEHGRGSDAARVARTVFAAYDKVKGDH